MKRLFIIIMISSIFVSISMAETVVYRISSNEVVEIGTSIDSTAYDPTYFSYLTDPTMADGSMWLDANSNDRVLGYAKIHDNGVIRNATQGEIDGFLPAAVDDYNKIEAAKAIKYFKENPQFRRIMTAFAAILVDEFNILRAEHGLSDRSLSQLKTAIENRISKDD